MNRGWIGGVALAALCAACGGDDEGSTPGGFETYADACDAIDDCSSPRVDLTAPTERIFRVLVVRAADGTVSFGGIEAVDVVEGSGVPIGPLSGTHVLAGLDASGVSLDGQALRFPETFRLESYGDDSWLGADVDLSAEDVATVGYVRALPEVTELALVAADGTILATTPAEPTIESTDPGAARAPLIGLSSPHCAHILVIDGEPDRPYARGLPYNLSPLPSGETVTIELVQPGPTQLAVLQAALNRMTPLHCHAIGRVAFGRVPSMPELGGAVQGGSSDLILINVAARDGTTGRSHYEEENLARDAIGRARMMRTILHEAGHATEHLLNATASTSDAFGGFWDPSSRTLASETIARVRLDKGLAIEWQRVHESFVSLGWARAYPCVPGRPCDTDGAAFRSGTDWGAHETTEAGVMSRYGGTSYWDDIADMVSWPIAAPVFADAGLPNGPRNKEDFACQELGATSGDEVPSRVAAVYTKLKFLQDLGLVHTDDVDACIGAGVRLPIDAPGFDFWQDDVLRRSFRDGLGGTILHYTDDRNAFEARGAGAASFDGTEYPATIRVELQLGPGPLELASYPRGVYVLGAGGNVFELRMPDAPAGNFDVTEGFALVAEASASHIAGSLHITEGFRLDAPVPVPQVFDPPLIIRFMIGSSR